MIIGTIKETKNGEGRVGLTPELVNELYLSGHKVLVEKGSGAKSCFDDVSYFMAGAEIVETATDVVSKCDLLVKIKEPTPDEFYLLDLMKGKMLLTFLHLGANRKLADKLCECKITGISYDTIENKFGELYILKPMSVIAGELAAYQVLELYKAGSSRKPKKVCIVGAGVSGQSAFKQLLYLFNKTAKTCLTDLHIFDLNAQKLQELQRTVADKYYFDLSKKQNITYWNRGIETQDLKNCDAVIGAVLIPGKKAPIVITKEQLNVMPKKSLLVDIAIDQGGCIEGVHPTTLDNKYYEENGLYFSCVPNLPGSDPARATNLLVLATSKIVYHLASFGIEQTCKNLVAFEKGINTRDGKVVNETVLRALNEG
jgi:alanine dehydrogenase